MEKEQELQERNHVRMNLEMNHHHDHEKYDQVQGDQEQKLYVYTVLTHCPYQSWCEVCVCGIKRQKRSLSS